MTKQAVKSVFKRLGRFSASSLLGFVVDNVVFTVVLVALQSPHFLRRHDILISLIVARAVSASVNYAANKKYVFRSHAALSSSFMRYWALVVIIAALSYAGTALLSYALDLRGPYITVGKIVVETVLFILSYRLQRIWVFGPTQNR
jgi:putative flippase GtrA